MPTGARGWSGCSPLRGTSDPHWDLLYLGRWALDAEDHTVAEGIVRPGYSYCTFGYALSPSGLAALLNCGFERALIPVDELIPALYMDHPREDIRSLYPKRLRAYAFEPPLITQLPKEEAGSDTEDSAFVASSETCPPHVSREFGPRGARRASHRQLPGRG